MVIQSNDMGMFQVNVRVENPHDPSKYFEEMFWVDTGALYSFVPEDRLLAIGLAPKVTREFVLADGRRDRRLVGEALLTVDELGETMTCPIVFGPPDSLYLLGATALENFSVQADPIARKLRPVAAVIGTMLVGRAVEP